MKLIWSPAVTLDGNIATADGNSDWPTTKDGELFSELVKQYGAVIVGRVTLSNTRERSFLSKALPLLSGLTILTVIPPMKAWNMSLENRRKC